MPVKSIAQAVVSRITVWGVIAALFFAACPNPMEAPVLVERVTINGGNLTLEMDKTVNLSMYVTPGNAGNKNVSWSSANEAIVAVDHTGRVTALSVGRAAVIASARDGSGRTGLIIVTVINTPPPLVESVVINGGALALTPGEGVNLTVTAIPMNAGNKNVSWSSDNKGVVEVGAATGQVIAHAVGMAKITATALDGSGKKSAITVTVTDIPPPRVTNIVINGGDISLQAGEMAQLSVTVSPEDAGNKHVTWSSGNEAAAAVSEAGLVTAMAAGAATITATAQDGSGKTASITVTVTDIPPALVESVAIDEGGISLKEGGSAQLHVTVLPGNAGNKNVIWSSGDEAVAKVDAAGLVTAIAAGTATITAEAQDGSGKTDTIAIIVTGGLSIKGGDISLEVGGRAELSVTEDDGKVEWSSDNDAAVTVNEAGRVEAVALGTAAITARDSSGASDSITVTVTDAPPALVESLVINGGDLSLQKGSGTNLSVTVSPENAGNKNVTWSSGDETIAKVDAAGLVTAVKNGEATITAAAQDGSGKTASITVTVTDAPPALVESLAINGGDFPLQKGSSKQLSVTVSPENAGNKNVTWSSGDKEAATVSDAGLVTALAAGGTAKITAAAQDGSGKTASIIVTLRPALVESLAINGGNISLQKGDDAALSVTVSPESAEDKTVIWTSSNNAVAEVNETGRVRAVGNGAAEITATARDGSGKKSVITVTVTEAPLVLVTGVEIAPGELSLSVGSSYKLTVKVTPPNAANPNVEWDVSGDAVEVVQNGTVRAVSAGTATVRAAAQDGSGKNDAITVTVTGGTGEGPGPVDPGPGDPGPGPGPTDPGVSNPDPPPGGGSNQSGDVTIIESKGWLETLYVSWNKLSGAAGYNVYYKGGAVGDWVKIDDPLIREYGGYFRADILGLAAARDYEVKVASVNASNVEGTNPAFARNIEVKAHDRSGFAFNNGAVPGAYQANGVPKANARILYITDKSKDTVTLAVKTSSSKEETLTGLSAILKAFEKGYETRPLIARFIGRITESGFTLEAGDVMVKDNGKNNNKTSYITLEGVGNDATAYGWGIRTSRASNLEIRNIGFMLTKSSGKDDIELQNSEYVWVHNCDLFYGSAGGDADQVKGDGALDSKEATFVTFSYNHFWDTGKSNLLGNGTETPGYLTYHHNWYDHSDSRHPRVRWHQVHVYNNYYDGVAKYGIGATQASSIFAEANYFRNTKNPMLISMQGTDVINGDANGTFSKENGGIIKAYNNYMDDSTRSRYRPYSADRTVEFDAYEVKSAGEVVPDAVKTKKGGTSYSNFTISYPYTADNPATAQNNVITWAGRYWGGDFSFAFNNAVDDTSSDINAALKSKLQSYTGGLVAVQGESGAANPGGGDGGTTNPGGGDGGATNPGGGDIVCHFTGSKPSSAAITVSGNYSNSKGSVTVDGTAYNVCVKMEGSTSVSFTLSEAMTLKLWFGLSSDSAAGKKVKIDDANQTVGSDGTLTVSLAAGGHTIKKGDTMNLFYLSLAK